MLTYAGEEEAWHEVLQDKTEEAKDKKEEAIDDWTLAFGHPQRKAFGGDKTRLLCLGRDRTGWQARLPASTDTGLSLSLSLCLPLSA
jgi:hypothetical protein